MRAIVLWLLLLAACSPQRRLSQSIEVKLDSTAQAGREAESSRTVKADYATHRVRVDLKFAPLTPELISQGITTPPISEATQITEQALVMQSDSSASAESTQSVTQLSRQTATETDESRPLAWWQRSLIWVGGIYIIRLITKIATQWGNLTFKSLIKLF